MDTQTSQTYKPLFSYISRIWVLHLLLSKGKKKGMKLKTLSLEDKLRVLDQVDACTSVQMVYAEFDLKTSTSCDIKKNRDRIQQHSLSLEDCSNKVKMTFKPAKLANLDKTVYKW